MDFLKNTGIYEINEKVDIYTMKARKTTLEERIEIVKYALTNDNDYTGTAAKYNVPYASVYQWVNKYIKLGEDGLSDKRGRPSKITNDKELTTEEKQAIQIANLTREIEKQNLIIEVLKKRSKSRNN